MSNQFLKIMHRICYALPMTEAAPWGPDKYLAGKAWEDRYGRPGDIMVRRNAVARANYAIKVGKLVRQPCQCGNTKTDAHHDDYYKPLAVRWLCRQCHAAEHAKETF